jgi:hypothetical protein
MSAMDRFEIFKRDKFRCQYCGCRPPAAMLEIEHVHPVSKGGTSEPWNLVTACHDCNQGKLARPLSMEQIRQIDGHVPNVIAQLLAHELADAYGSGYRPSSVAQRLFDISTRGVLFGEWLAVAEELLTTANMEGDALMIAGGDTE